MRCDVELNVYLICNKSFQMMDLLALGMVILLSIRPDILANQQVQESGPQFDGIFAEDLQHPFQAVQHDQRNFTKGYPFIVLLQALLNFLT